METRILTPEQVVAEMSALTEILRTRPNHLQASLGVNINKYDNFIPLFDVGHQRTVGWDNQDVVTWTNTGLLTSRLRPGSALIRLEQSGLQPAFCPEFFTPVRKRYIMYYFSTVYASTFHSMESDLEAYRVQYEEYNTAMGEYAAYTGNVIRTRPRAPRRPQYESIPSTAFGSSVRTLGFFCYKELRSRFSSIIYAIRNDTSRGALVTLLNQSRTAANTSMTTAWDNTNGDLCIGVKLTKDFQLIEDASIHGGGAPQIEQLQVAAVAAVPVAPPAAQPPQPSAFEKDCALRQSGHRILVIKDDRSWYRDPCIYSSPRYTKAYRKQQEHYEEELRKLIADFEALEAADRTRYDEEYRYYEADRQAGRYAERPRRVSRKREWNEAIHALTEEMKRVIIEPEQPQIRPSTPPSPSPSTPPSPSPSTPPSTPPSSPLSAPITPPGLLLSLTPDSSQSDVTPQSDVNSKIESFKKGILKKLQDLYYNINIYTNSFKEVDDNIQTFLEDYNNLKKKIIELAMVEDSQYELDNFDDNLKKYKEEASRLIGVAKGILSYDFNYDNSYDYLDKVKKITNIGKLNIVMELPITKTLNRGGEITELKQAIEASDDSRGESKEAEKIIKMASDNDARNKDGTILYLYKRTRLMIRCLFLNYLVDEIKRNDKTKRYIRLEILMAENSKDNSENSKDNSENSEDKYKKLKNEDLVKICTVLKNVLKRNEITVNGLKLTKYQDPDLALIAQDHAYSKRLMTI